ncbi:RNA-directed DNA polymerase from mobile element jockey [Trichonephila clavipes]|nr:RNA-directed DNA polymerase from mobile element jockey [Trichonephila clavipes]
MKLTFNPRHRNRSNLTVISWNANGIRSRIEEFRSFIADWNPDIVNLQETHLQTCHNFIFPDYNIYRNDRTFRGGCTAIMIKRSIPHHQIVLNNNSLETTAIKLTRQDDESVTIVSAYRPPRKPLPEQDLHRIFRSQGYVLVAGDLNAKHVSWSPLTQQNVPGTTIRRFCDNTGYALVASSEPTRFHWNCRNTTIDIAICKGMTVSECTSIPELSSDHNPVLFEATPDDDSLYKLVKSVSKNKTFHVPPLVGPMGLHYSPEDKVDLFADSLESSFQEKPEPYDDDFIDHVEEKVDRFFHRNSRRHTAPLTSPQEIMDIILQLPNKKAPGKDGIKNIALKALPLNAITNITKIINSCLFNLITFHRSGSMHSSRSYQNQERIKDLQKIIAPSALSAPLEKFLENPS